jgi:hypothetical protein
MLVVLSNHRQIDTQLAGQVCPDGGQATRNASAAQSDQAVAEPKPSRSLNAP